MALFNLWRKCGRREICRACWYLPSGSSPPLSALQPHCAKQIARAHKQQKQNSGRIRTRACYFRFPGRCLLLLLLLLFILPSETTVKVRRTNKPLYVRESCDPKLLQVLWLGKLGTCYALRQWETAAPAAPSGPCFAWNIQEDRLCILLVGNNTVFCIYSIRLFGRWILREAELWVQGLKQWNYT